jgi:DSF synthase
LSRNLEFVVTVASGQYQPAIDVSTSSSRSSRAYIRPFPADLLPAGVPGIEAFAGVSPKPYQELDVALDRETKACWCFMRPHGIPSFTRNLLRELIAFRHAVQQLFTIAGTTGEPPLKYLVGGSRLPGIYNLGGDLGFFAACICTGDREGLRSYAYDCVDVGYHVSIGFNAPLITIALVQGDALGGGFEGALSFDVLIAERSARFGLPEILFNLFPGMGAFSFLSRKLDAARAQRMIMSGRIYSAEELFELGLVDVIAEDGEGEEAVRDYIARNARRHAVHCSIYEARRRLNPLSLQELRDITDVWVETAMQLTASDLRKMERLMTLQVRRLAGSSPQIRAKAM